MAGLEPRYHVQKINDPTGEHDECRYFVLDPQHDPHALAALVAYADSCETDYPDLAADLRALTEKADPTKEEVSSDG